MVEENTNFKWLRKVSLIGDFELKHESWKRDRNKISTWVS